MIAMDIRNPTDAQILEAVRWRARRDFRRGENAVRPIEARGMGRPEEGEPEPDDDHDLAASLHLHLIEFDRWERIRWAHR